MLLVVGSKIGSALLKRAVLLSQRKRDRGGKWRYYVSTEMEQRLGITGSIQLSGSPKIISDKDKIENLKGILARAS